MTRAATGHSGVPGGYTQQPATAVPPKASFSRSQELGSNTSGPHSASTVCEKRTIPSELFPQCAPARSKLEGNVSFAKNWRTYASTMEWGA